MNTSIFMTLYTFLIFMYTTHCTEPPNFEYKSSKITYPEYNFDYEIIDPVSGDIKSQTAIHDGDQTKGYYSLVQPDGSVRIVEYVADDMNEFNAVVKKVHKPAHHSVLSVIPLQGKNGYKTS